MAVSMPSRSKRPLGRRKPARALLATVGSVGLAAVAGGIALIINGLGIPREELAGTRFDSALLPGLILTMIVGGGLLATAWSVYVRPPSGLLASLAAATILLAWIVFPMALAGVVSWLQPLVLAFALLTIGLAWLLQRGAPASQRGADGSSAPSRAESGRRSQRWTDARRPALTCRDGKGK